jgi:hypothetical protein
MYQVIGIASEHRAASVYALRDPDGAIVGTTDDGWSRRELAQYAGALNAARS